MGDIGLVGPVSESRKRHFKEVIEYAMERVSTGGHRASQRQLAERIMCAPGMIRRYLDMQTSVEGLKFVTLLSIAKACRLDPGTLFVWIEQGRQSALLHEAALHGTVPPFGALDLAKRLVEILEDGPGGDGGGDGGGPPKPGLAPVRQQLRVLEQEVGALMAKMVRLTEAEDALRLVMAEDTAPEMLNEGHWRSLSRLLEVAPEVLQQNCCMPVLAG
jgi:hypothetical protein